jgi:parvulin-like peptidyl-prolyl isomerase
MKGMDAQRTTARAARRRFFAATAGLLAAAAGFPFMDISPVVAQTPRTAAQSPYQPAQAGPQARPATPNRPNAPVVTAQNVPLNQATPRVTNAPASTTTAIRPNPTDLQVMAVVNGEQITQQELGRECLWRFGKEVLEGMINRQLIAAACQQKRIQITNADIDAEIDRIAGKFGLPRDRWMQLLREERGYNEIQYRNEVIWPMLALRRLSDDQLQITADEMKKAFESEFGPKVRALLIVTNTRQKADQAYSSVTAKPETFREVSKQLSDDPAVASAYGTIPPIRRHLGDPKLEQIAFNLKPGDISPVIQVADKYYILKCEEQIPARILTPEQQKAQESRIADRIKEGKLRTVAANFFEQMQKSAQIRNYYTDPELGKQMPGVAAVVNNQPITFQQLTAECLNRYGSEVLEGEISRKVLMQELNRRKLQVTQADIDAEIARAAELYGVTTKDGKPDIERWLAQITDQDKAPKELYIRDAVWPSVALKKIVGNQVIITEEDLQKAYEANYGERVEVLAIVCSDQRQAQRVWEDARNNPTDDFFAKLAEQHSVEPSSRANGGKVPPIQRHSGSPQLEAEAFRLKPGELSGIIAVNGQFIILRCLGRTRPIQVDKNEARAILYKDLEERKLRVSMSREFDRLLQTAQIDNYIEGTSQTGREAATRSPFPQQGPAGVAPAGGAAAPRNPGGVVPTAGTSSRPTAPTKR